LITAVTQRKKSGKHSQAQRLAAQAEQAKYDREMHEIESWRAVQLRKLQLKVSYELDLRAKQQAAQQAQDADRHRAATVSRDRELLRKQRNDRRTELTPYQLKVARATRKREALAREKTQKIAALEQTRALQATAELQRRQEAARELEAANLARRTKAKAADVDLKLQAEAAYLQKQKLSRKLLRARRKKQQQRAQMRLERQKERDARVSKALEQRAEELRLKQERTTKKEQHAATKALRRREQLAKHQKLILHEKNTLQSKRVQIRLAQQQNVRLHIANTTKRLQHQAEVVKKVKTKQQQRVEAIKLQNSLAMEEKKEFMKRQKVQQEYKRKQMLLKIAAEDARLAQLRKDQTLLRAQKQTMRSEFAQQKQALMKKLDVLTAKDAAVTDSKTLREVEDTFRELGGEITLRPQLTLAYNNNNNNNNKNSNISYSASPRPHRPRRPQTSRRRPAPHSARAGRIHSAKKAHTTRIFGSVQPPFSVYDAAHSSGDKSDEDSDFEQFDVAFEQVLAHRASTPTATTRTRTTTTNSGNSGSSSSRGGCDLVLPLYSELDANLSNLQLGDNSWRTDALKEHLRQKQWGLLH
jgi:hypothetical protein